MESKRSPEERAQMLIDTYYEFKLSINEIINTLENLKDENLGAPANGMLNRVIAICRNLLKGVNQLLEVFEVQIEETKAIPDEMPPFDVAKINTPIVIDKSAQNKSIEKLNILIVNNKLIEREALQKNLRGNYNLSFAKNGEQALDKLITAPPQLIITDLVMPVMDGLAFIGKLRKNKKFNKIPIIVISTNDNVVDRLKSFRLGANDFINNQYDEIDLKSRIYRLLDFSKKSSRKEKDIFLDSKIKTSIELSKSALKQDIQFLETLEEQIDALSVQYDFDVEKLAKTLMFSKAQLTRKMKKLTGLTPKKYIDEIRMLKAWRLILNEKFYSVKEIAFTVGFRDEKLFSRHFKSRFGKYPSEDIE